ncbi:hypothetical protein AB0B66_08075 [Catellatospora sp. NPDC049111]|uniref:hypothetical protein n=1 Tax=Catellatospora sp. NPDC049111 TaxID=3155271 RepID=UPI0034017E65
MAPAPCGQYDLAGARATINGRIFDEAKGPPGLDGRRGGQHGCGNRCAGRTREDRRRAADHPAGAGRRCAGERRVSGGRRPVTDLADAFRARHCRRVAAAVGHTEPASRGFRPARRQGRACRPETQGRRDAVGVQCDLLEFPPLDPEADDAGEVLAEVDGAVEALAPAERATDAVRERWANFGVAAEDYFDYVRSGRLPDPLTQEAATDVVRTLLATGGGDERTVCWWLDGLARRTGPVLTRS